MTRTIVTEHLMAYHEYLLREEKSTATIEKYIRDTHIFVNFVGDREVSKEITVDFKKALEEQKYAVRSINSMLASLNSFLSFLGWTDCKVKTLRCQKEVYCSEDKELRKDEYMRLLSASQKQQQLNLIMQTICSTGIRVSEIKYFTVETVTRGEVVVQCKNKIRTILIPSKLRKLLLQYAKQRHITKGAIFVSKNGNPIDRSTIWAKMKKLCKVADVNPAKVFPHNLRKLFARTFYTKEKDIAKLADILGHESIETTRIYIMTTSNEHLRKIERLGLVVDLQNRYSQSDLAGCL